MKFKLNLSMEELKKRTSIKYLKIKNMLDANSVEYQNLKENDKICLKYLLKAGEIIEKINMKLDNKYNILFKQFLESEIKQNNKKAKLTKILFDAQKGIFAYDMETNEICLAKEIKNPIGKGVYPEDLEKEEFINIIKKMLKNKKIDEVRKILNQRSVVERKNNELIAIDYIDKFKIDFDKICIELEKAKKYSTNKDFTEYLELQINAFRKADPKLDGLADKKWATLQNTELEFTITRENYAENLTSSVLEDTELKNLLKKYQITPINKDFLGARIGIVNKDGTEKILKVKKYLSIMAENMPYKDEYIQNINSDEDKQTMVDVDLINLYGDVGEYRGGITLAENLPNDDKYSIQFLNGGRRNVYHRQIRLITSVNEKNKLKKKLNYILDKTLHKYYNHNADHYFTIGHENGHSLGPKGSCEELGKYKSILEENKADMISLAMLDILTKNGLYTEREKKEIIVSYATDNMLKSKPNIKQAHRVRSVMQNYYFIKKGAMKINKDGILSINIDKMTTTAMDMLKEIIRIQIDKDFDKAEKYVLNNFIWTEEMEIMSLNIKKVSKVLNGTIKTELSDKILNKI